MGLDGNVHIDISVRGSRVCVWCITPCVHVGSDVYAVEFQGTKLPRTSAAAARPHSSFSEMADQKGPDGPDESHRFQPVKQPTWSGVGRESGRWPDQPSLEGHTVILDGVVYKKTSTGHVVQRRVRVLRDKWVALRNGKAECCLQRVWLRQRLRARTAQSLSGRTAPCRSGSNALTSLQQEI